MSTAASGVDSLASKCLAFCQALVSQGQVFNFSLSIGSDFTFSLDTRSKDFESQVNKKKPSPSTQRRNARRRAEFMAKKQQIPPSRTSIDGEAVQASAVFPCEQCDYLGASEKGLKQHVRMKHKKAKATPASPEVLRSKEESRSLIGSPHSLHTREENCQNCDEPFTPGHQCGDEEEAEDDEEESDEEPEPPLVSSNDENRAILGMLLHLNAKVNQTIQK